MTIEAVAPPTSDSHWLSENFAPVHEEHTLTDLTVTGRLPEWLDGRYLRIGPNPLGDPGPGYHWFMGDGMVHGVRLEDGVARWYRNRWVRSGPVAKKLGEPFHGRVHGVDFADNTNVLQHGGRTLALNEGGPVPYELTDELDTVGHCTFGGTLPRGYTAHPHEDPVTGELHAISYNWRRGNRVEYSVVGADGRVRDLREIEVGGSPMIHDCAITENYVIVLDLPVVFDIPTALRSQPKLIRPMAKLSLNRIVGRDPLPDAMVDAIARGQRTMDAEFPLPYAWDPSYPARIGLLPRAAGATDVQWFEIDPCYVFHTVNAYEADGSVVLDVVRHDRMFATDHTGPNEGATRLTRFTLDLATGRASESGLDELTQEFPRIDERLTGRRHRFAYTVGMHAAAAGERGPSFADAVVKHDLDTGRIEQHPLGRTAGEFCFVPTPGGTSEDDGVLLGYTFDPDAGRSDLTVLDAASLEPVAAVHLPVRVPAGFHGNWAPSQSTR